MASRESGGNHRAFRPDLGGFPLVLAVALTVLGLGLLGAGVAAVFLAREGAGSAALLGVGAVLIFFGVVGDRLESLKYGDLEVALRRKADEAARRGDIEAAEVLQHAADTIGQRITQVASSYKSVRSTMPAGSARTARMEEIIEQARKDAYAPGVDQEKVLSLLWTGSEGARVWALGVLQARPELATTRAVLEALERPDEPFDHYHALVLAERFMAAPQASSRARKRVREAVMAQLDSGAFGTDTDRHALANRLLQQEFPSWSAHAPGGAGTPPRP
jgi:hypothetical protein